MVPISAPLRGIRPDATVVAKACSLFVALAEEGWTDGAIVEAVIHRYLDACSGSIADLDTLLLGCTHFPLLIDALHAVVDRAVTIVDSAATTRRRWSRICALAISPQPCIGPARSRSSRPTVRSALPASAAAFSGKSSAASGRTGRPDRLNCRSWISAYPLPSAQSKRDLRMLRIDCGRRAWPRTSA